MGLDSVDSSLLTEQSDLTCKCMPLYRHMYLSPLSWPIVPAFCFLNQRDEYLSLTVFHVWVAIPPFEDTLSVGNTFLRQIITLYASCSWSKRCPEMHSNKIHSLSGRYHKVSPGPNQTWLENMIRNICQTWRDMEIAIIGFNMKHPRSQLQVILITFECSLTNA